MYHFCWKRYFYLSETLTNLYDIFEKFDKEIDFSILMNECKGMNKTIFLASPYITCHVAFNPTVLHSNIEYVPMVFFEHYFEATRFRADLVGFTIWKRREDSITFHAKLYRNHHSCICFCMLLWLWFVIAQI